MIAVCVTENHPVFAYWGKHSWFNHEARLKQVLLFNVQISAIDRSPIKLIIPFQKYCSYNFLSLIYIVSKFRRSKTLIWFIEKTSRNRNWLSTLLERVNTQIFEVNFKKIFFIFLMVSFCCDVGDSGFILKFMLLLVKCNDNKMV